MNPFEKGEKARRGSFSKEIKATQAAKYENDRRSQGATFLFAQPDCGSRTIMRIMSRASFTTCVGSLSEECYASIMGLHRSFNKGSYGDLDLQGYSDYLGKNEEHDKMMMRYHLRNFLFKTHSYSGFHTTHIIGSPKNNINIVDFVDMLRDIFEDSILTIGFMTNKVDEQYQAFREVYELGDVVFTTEQFLSDPEKYVLLLKPNGYPHHHIANRILAEEHGPI